MGAPVHHRQAHRHTKHSKSEILLIVIVCALRASINACMRFPHEEKTSQAKIPAHALWFCAKVRASTMIVHGYHCAPSGSLRVSPTESSCKSDCAITINIVLVALVLLALRALPCVVLRCLAFVLCVPVGMS